MYTFPFQKHVAEQENIPWNQKEVFYYA